MSRVSSFKDQESCLRRQAAKGKASYIFYEKQKYQALIQKLCGSRRCRAEMTCATETGSDIILARVPGRLGSVIKLQKFPTYLDLVGNLPTVYVQMWVSTSERCLSQRLSSSIILNKDTAHSLHICGFAPLWNFLVPNEARPQAEGFPTFTTLKVFVQCELSVIQ